MGIMYNKQVCLMHLEWTEGRNRRHTPASSYIIHHHIDTKSTLSQKIQKKGVHGVHQLWVPLQTELQIKWTIMKEFKRLHFMSLFLQGCVILKSTCIFRAYTKYTTKCGYYIKKSVYSFQFKLLQQYITRLLNTHNIIMWGNIIN